MERHSLTDLPEIGLPAKYEVRAADTADEEGIARVLRLAFDVEWDADRVRRNLTGAPDVDSVYVVTAAGQVAATASARLAPGSFPGRGYLHWVGVAPEWRGRGLGAAVCVRVLHRFAELGLNGAVLETDDHRLDAVRLYLRLGFEPSPRTETDPGRWDAVLNALEARKER